MYLRLIAINPIVAGEITLSENHAITTDAYCMDRGPIRPTFATHRQGSIYEE